MIRKILLLVLNMVFLIPTAFADDLGLYDHYYLAPNPKNAITKPKGYQVTKIDRECGYYIDGRGQVPEHQRILPPNSDKIPEKSHPTKTVVAFDRYYDINHLGMRRNPDMTPWIPNYNCHYSNRRAEPYTRQEFIDVWCPGVKNLNGVDCQTEQYAITFVRARNWAFGVIKAPIKARKTGKQTALFLMVDELGLDAPHMHDAMHWSKQFNMPMFFGTIDAYIPNDWII